MLVNLICNICSGVTLLNLLTHLTKIHTACIYMVLICFTLFVLGSFFGFCKSCYFCYHFLTHVIHLSKISDHDGYHLVILKLPFGQPDIGNFVVPCNFLLPRATYMFKLISIHYNDGVSNHRPLDGLLNRLFRRRSKKTSKLRVTGLSEGNSPVTGELSTQRASNAENISIWWRHHEKHGIV